MGTLARTRAKVAWMARFINTSKSLEGTFCICQENASRSESVGIGIIVVANERDVVEDMEVERSGEVVAEEDSIIPTCPIGGEEARWTEMSTAGAKEAIMA